MGVGVALFYCVICLELSLLMEMIFSHSVLELLDELGNFVENEFE